ncbi:MAG: molybdate ABC transporter substrate-binding protein [Gammaproteobacteria bacterium]
MRKLTAAIFCALTAFGATCANGALADDVLVFAASSLSDALGAVVARYGKHSDDRVVASFASSSALARQIESGAPADIYVSADMLWMDYLEKRDLIRAGTRTDLLSNRLVLIAPADSAVKPVDIAAGFPMVELLGNGPLAMGDPAHVPAGLYGKQALKSLHIWSQVNSKVAGAGDVRAALALVASGEAPLGIVYQTDARAENNVKTIGTFPASTHSPIVYPAAVVAPTESPEAQAFYGYMLSNEAREMFQQYGFLMPD